MKPSVTNLYLRILEKEFSSSLETREEDKKRLEMQIEETMKRIKVIDLGWVTGVITPEKYKVMSQEFEHKLAELKLKHNSILQMPSEYSKYIKFGVSIIGNLSGFYEDSDLLIKKKLIGSIFPEKLVFENNDYRTAKSNAFLEFFTLNINDLGIKKGGKSAAVSTPAPETGLEPVTL